METKVCGFYLDFEDSSNLGNCAFDGTDFTESNLAATDQMTDSPTNNFCVINSLFFGSGLGGNDSVSITRGNLVAHDYSGIFIPCTFFVNKGKWYWENKIGSQTDANILLWELQVKVLFHLVIWKMLEQQVVIVYLVEMT